jgi:hypothetical protein
LQRQTQESNRVGVIYVFLPWGIHCGGSPSCGAEVKLWRLTIKKAFEANAEDDLGSNHAIELLPL